jgi:hypothetical protein
MISTQTFIYLVIIFLITVGLGYLMGISVVRVVDDRLSDISINLPKIHLPRQNIMVSMPRERSNLSDLNVDNEFVSPADEKWSNQGPVYQLKPRQSPIKPLALQKGGSKDTNVEGFTNPSEADDDEKDLIRESVTESVYRRDFKRPEQPTTAPKVHQVESHQVGRINQIPQAAVIDQIDGDRRVREKCDEMNRQNQPAVGCQTDADCNVVFGNGRNKCLSNNKCYCVDGSGLFCHYGPTYYKDPKDMTDRQLQKFKRKAKFERMTVQDYVNWLMLFEDDIEALAPRHVHNFNRIRKGIRLTLDDIPRDKIPPPMTAQDYFNQLYTLDDQINIYAPQVSNTAGVQLPANYAEFSHFRSPQNLKHLTIRPMTLDQELVKQGNKDVIRQTRSRISNDWELATN